MTMPQFLPGTVTKPQVSLEQRVVELESRLAEFMRRDLSNSVVGQGGRFRAVYSDGTESILVGLDPADGRQKIRIHDPAGNTLIESDTDAGWGFRFPTITSPTYHLKPDFPANATAAFQSYFVCNFNVDHPRTLMSMGLSVHGATGQGSGFWQVNSSRTGITTLPTHVTPTGVGQTYFSDEIIWTEADYGSTIQLLWKVAQTGTIAGGNDVVPIANYIEQRGLLT